MLVTMGVGWRQIKLPQRACNALLRRGFQYEF